MSGTDEPGLFSPRVVAAMIAAGALSFLAFLWLTAYSPDLRSGRDGGAHALSNAAVGFKGLGELLDDVGGRAVRVRDKSALRRPGLLVLTPTTMTDPKLIASIVNKRFSGRTLIILPKWITTPLKTGRQGWVSSFGVDGGASTARLVSELVKVSVAVERPKARRGQTVSGLLEQFPVPARAQTIGGEKIEPFVATQSGRILVGRIRSHPAAVYIVADPDLLNNMGLKNLATARAAIGLMDRFSEGANREVVFDLTLNGFEGTSNLLKLAFEAPFLPATLCLLVAAVLAALGAFFPFGPAIREARAISFGKRALVDNSADLIVGAGRETLVARRYAALIREAAATRLGLAPGLPPEEVAARLESLGASGHKTFGALAAEADGARGRSAVAAATAALHRWKKEVLA